MSEDTGVVSYIFRPLEELRDTHFRRARQEWAKYRWRCSKKKPFNGRTSANRYARHLEEVLNGQFTVYKCPVCFRFHVMRRHPDDVAQYVDRGERLREVCDFGLNVQRERRLLEEEPIDHATLNTAITAGEYADAG